MSSAAHDFKGNLLSSSRRIAVQYKEAVGWAAVDAALPPNATATFDPVALEAALSPRLETEAFTSSTTYDALNRALTVTTPDHSVVRPGYNEANLLERMDANLRGATHAGQPVWTPFVTDIDYDATGQRTQIIYGRGATAGHKGVTTTYSYDRLTLRLVRLTTQRDATAFRDDCPQPPAAGWPGCQVQDLRYTYDPAGNITHIADGAQQAIFFRNTRVEPSSEYTYDALYRLIEAAGREHLGQLRGAPTPHSHDDAARVGLLHPHDGRAMGAYVEQYVYEAADSGHLDAASAAALFLGNLLGDGGDVARACTAYRIVVDSGHPDVAPLAAFRLGKLLGDEGDVSGARTAYQAAVDSGHPDVTPLAAAGLGILLAQQWDIAGACAAYEVAVDSGHPGHAQAAALSRGP